MPTLKVNGAQLHFEEHGAGAETVVFAHGLLWSGRKFDEQVTALKDRYCLLDFVARRSVLRLVADRVMAIMFAEKSVSDPGRSELLRCISLTEKGLLRWQMQCFRTPAGITPRDPKLSCVSLIHGCLVGPRGGRDAAFGPASMAANTRPAKGKVSARSFAPFLAMQKIIRNVAGSRLSGSFRQNPFLRLGTAEPIAAPPVPRPAERAALSEGTA
jgi:hypothetical protein